MTGPLQLKIFWSCLIINVVVKYFVSQCFMSCLYMNPTCSSMAKVIFQIYFKSEKIADICPSKHVPWHLK